MNIISLAKLRKAVPHRKPGYLEAVMAVATPVSDTHIQIPEKDFARIRHEYSTPAFTRTPPEPSGPGTELKSLLASFGITSSPTCKCNKMARQMDSWGPEESLKHIEEIVDVMQETARSRKLPFLRLVGRKLVRVACNRARKKSAQTGQ